MKESHPEIGFATLFVLYTVFDGPLEYQLGIVITCQQDIHGEG